MKRHVRPAWIVGAVALVLAAALVAARGRGHEARYSLVPIDRGDIVDVVGATGALQAVTTVQVGSQVSGTIDSLLADFNSVVHKGEVIARLDTSLFEARVAQARANLSSARANVEKAHADVTDARQKYDRAQELARELPAAQRPDTPSTSTDLRRSSARRPP
jgi:HlyD family secretion protein